MILIPYGNTIIYGKAVLINKGIAELSDFYQKTENYIFKSTFNLQHESLLMGKNASMIITPKLTLHNIECSLDLIKKCEVRITMKSFIDDLPMTKVFDNIDFHGSKDIVVNFQVPPNLGSLEAVINVEFTNLTQGI